MNGSACPFARLELAGVTAIDCSVDAVVMTAEVETILSVPCCENGTPKLTVMGKFPALA